MVEDQFWKIDAYIDELKVQLIINFNENDDSDPDDPFYEYRFIWLLCDHNYNKQKFDPLNFFQDASVIT